MTNPTLSSITTFLDELLPPLAYLDSSQNGLQLDAGRGDVTHIAFAVDAGESVIAEAVSRGADLLVVHHGLLWSTAPAAITGPLGRKVKLLIEGGCSLYGSHLPLDGHQEVGNGAQLAQMLGLHDVKPFCFYKGGPVGCWGRCTRTMTFESASSILQALSGASPHLILPFGKSSFSTVAIVTGSGSFALEECARADIDLFISGEPKHEAYHLAKELRQSALFAGHYATETVGVLALKQRLEQKSIEKSWNLRTSFIDEPSGI
jgi:dinuclear metal center YbgI/SA1388 family protein